MARGLVLFSLIGIAIAFVAVVAFGAGEAVKQAAPELAYSIDSVEFAAENAALAAKANPNVNLPISTEESHGVTKHGNDALRIRRCYENDPNPFWIETKGYGIERYIYVCQLGPREFGFRIVDKIKDAAGKIKLEEVTGYVKEGIHEWEDVTQYVIKMGYRKVTWKILK